MAGKLQIYADEELGIAAKKRKKRKKENREWTRIGTANGHEIRNRECVRGRSADGAAERLTQLASRKSAMVNQLTTRSQRRTGAAIS
jgi:hypothetical protein